MGNPIRFWKTCRTCFRIFRICVWLLILALVCAALWLDTIGLPGFVKRPLVGALQQHGIALQFVRLRLKLYRGLVVDNVRIGGETPDSPSLEVQEVQLQINYRALLQRKWQLDGVILRHGKFVLPVSASNDPPATLVVDQIQTELRFQTNDVWSLDNFQANFAGATFTLAGQVSHASAVPNWGLFHGKRGLRGATPAQLKRIGTAVSRIHFNKDSQLRLTVNGDATNINSFVAFLTVSAPDAYTPWGSMHDFELVARTAGSMTPAPKTGAAAEPPLEIDWKAQVSRLKTGMVSNDYAYCAGSWRANGEIDWQTRLASVKSEKLSADFVSSGGFWRAPNLEVTNLFARLGGGQLQAAARLNTETREFSFTNSSCFDIQAVNALLSEKTRERLAQFTLPRPPRILASGSLFLPAGINWTNWANASPNYLCMNMQPTIRLNGELAVTNMTYSGLSFDHVHARFLYSNEIWTVTDAFITRPESWLQISGAEDDATKLYDWHLHGAISPNIVRPFLPPKAARGFHDFVFNQPVFLDTYVRGRLYDYDSIIAEGYLSLTNFSLHGVSVDNAQSDFRYARLVAVFLRPHLQAGAQTMHADAVRLDWPGDRIYFTNGLGTADPELVARAIGPLQAQVMKPYYFPQLPTATVNGYAPLRDPTNADLVFKTVGTARLRCINLETPAFSGEIHWHGQSLILTNLTAVLYDGTGYGNAAFDFRPHNSADYSFEANFSNVNLHLFAIDLSSSSNQLERLDGIVSGRFVLTSGNTQDWRSCDGFGHIDMSNGLLWDVPVFGALSVPLNNIMPGLGSSRATDASAQFFMTNGVISTDNLRINTMPMILNGNGTVDLHGNLNAHFTASLLRNVPLFGPLFSVLTAPVTKIFECKVTGTWTNPKIRLLYLYPAQKLLFYMTQPFRSFRNLFPSDNQSNPSKK